MAKKAARYGAYQYFRTRIRDPRSGKYIDVYGKTKAEMEEKAEDLRAQLARAVVDEESPYVYQYAAAWFARVSGTMTQDRRAAVAREINRNICPVIGQKRLSEVTSDDVLDVLARRPDARNTREKTLQVLRGVFRAARSAKKIPDDPTEGVKPGGRRPEKVSALTPEQQQTLLDAVAGTSVELFVKLGLFAGLRREEICGLRWADVHLTAAVPSLDVRQVCRWPGNNQPVLSETLKSEAAWRSVPLPPPLLAALSSAWTSLPKAAQEAPGGRTVLSRPDGSPWSHQTFRKAWGVVEVRTAGPVTRTRVDPATGERVKVTEELHLGDRVFRHPGVVVSIDFPVTPHMLRHTYVTRLILGGMDVRRVQYLAGHSTPDVTIQIYTDLMGHRPEDLIDDVSAVFPG